MDAEFLVGPGSCRREEEAWNDVDPYSIAGRRARSLCPTAPKLEVEVAHDDGER